MIKWLRYSFLVLIVAFSNWSFSQEISYRSRTFLPDNDTIFMDSLTIYPNSFQLFSGSTFINRSEYELDYQHGNLILFSQYPDSLRTTYRLLPINLSKVYGDKDSTLIYNSNTGNIDQFKISSEDNQADMFGGTGLTKSGSISRGIAFGNSQNLSVNSSLNLELSGDIAPNLKLLASISDNNLPIQADGSTNKLQEFDQIFIQLYNDKFKLIAGDFWLKKPEGYFMTYKKRAQGLTLEYAKGKDSDHQWKTQFSGALSKGKFARQIIPGVEGNQGPYRLIGNENEPFIIVLAGTESVYIDGRLLERGQEYDYVINYNSAEVIFTARNQITKDSRIVIEFQYSAQNYARSLFQSSTTYTSKKMKFWINSYSEQDAKNQPLQQTLTNTQKKLLSDVGDSLQLARSSSIDSIGYFDNQVMYRLIDSLGYDSVLVFSVDQNKAFFKAVFEKVGAGNGNYILSSFNALGKVYKWIAPVAGISQGDYEPSRLLVAPGQKQMVSSGISYMITKRLKLETELVYTKNDFNTFSRLDANDDVGKAMRSRLTGSIPLGRDSLKKWNLETKLEVETLDKFFSPIEQYRAVEFDRDWNTRNKGFIGSQAATAIGANFKRGAIGNINIEAQHFQIGSSYLGFRSRLNGKWNQKGLNSVWDGSYLTSQTLNKNQFLRHKVDVSKSFKLLRIGFKDDHEMNLFGSNLMPLATTSYQFYDYQVYVANADSSKIGFKMFYQERFDSKSDSTRLSAAARAKTSGGELKMMNMKNQSLIIIGSYRELVIVNKDLINQTPENTILGRIDYELRAWKGAFTWNNFYEIGSGLELRRVFQYIQVNDGQGVYTWIDYNNDGIKDLNEFEVAQYIDQASYIRVFTPSNEYIKTFSNELNQAFFWRPERIWATKKGVKKFFSRFSDQARVRIARKANLFTGRDAFNPFSTSISDTNLMSTISTLRNSLFFNRTSSVFGGEFTYQDSRTKSLLANGFDSRQNSYTEIGWRWNIKRIITLESTVQKGIKIAEADYTTGRNYGIAYYFIKPSIIFQPTTSFRISLDGRYSDKRNDQKYGGDVSIVQELGSNFKYNRSEKGSLQGALTAVHIKYSGVQNSALGFEMLESLKPGLNFTWNLGYQHSISKTLQISFQYNGRRADGSKTIHSGGMEVRAFF